MTEDEIQKCIARICSFAQLEHNWDSYGGLPTTDDAIAAAATWLYEHGPIYKKPAVFPTTYGGVQFEWIDCDDEIRFGPDGKIEIDDD